ncbi:MAG: flagellar brake protein [Limnobacter sp.]|nr:flagellar brake protein [Limnobacter sp.]
MKDLSPLSRSSIKIGEELSHPIFGEDGQLLLAAGQVVQSEKQLDELAVKGLFQIPQWASRVVQSRSSAGTISPKADLRSSSRKHELEDPSESGSVLKMSVEGSEETYIVKLIGTIRRDAFLVTHPTRDGALVFIKEGQFWDFRAFYGTSVYHFNVKVEKVVLAPFPLMVMSWPMETQVESKVIRAARRIKCDIPTAMRVGSEPEVVNGYINNISTGGVEFVTRHKLKAGRGDIVRIAFQIILGDRKYLLEPAVTVMSSNREESDDQLKLGLAFSALDDREFAAIHAFVDHRLIQRIESPLYSKINTNI